MAIATVSLAAMDRQWGEGVLLVLPALDSCMEQLQQLQLRALSCITNVFIAAADPSIFARDNALVASVWQSLMSLLESVSRDLVAYRSGGGGGGGGGEGTDGGDELLDNLCHAAWAVARSAGPLTGATVQQS